MIALALLLAAASPLPLVSSAVETPGLGAGVSTSLDTNGKGVGTQTALDAERAFAADAQTLGQWSAFRKWAAHDATMFVPQPINAQAWLKDRKDPPKAIDWWPTASYVSCDGSLAVNTGGWKQPDGSVGYFSTVWQRQQDGGWKWIVDGGDDLKVARDRPSNVKVRRASCNVVPARKPRRPRSVDTIITGTRIAAAGEKSAFGKSDDHTLNWTWIVQANGGRTFAVAFWNGRAIDVLMADKIALAK